MPVDSRKKLHVPLPAEMHADLFAHSEKLGAPAATLAREAIEDWLRKRRQEELAAQIRTYAKKVAGTRKELDEHLEAAATEELAGVRG